MFYPYFEFLFDRSFNEARSVNQAAELQKLKDESAKHVAELQRQRGQLESQVVFFSFFFSIFFSSFVIGVCFG